MQSRHHLRIAAVLAGILTVAQTSPAGALVCAVEDRPGAAKISQDSRPSKGLVRTLAIFARFSDEDDGTDSAPDFGGRLFDAAEPGSVTHFYSEMSHGQFRLEGSALPKVYTAQSSASSYLATQTGNAGQFGRYVLEILEAADADIDFGDYDNDGPDGIPNSGDDDGYVDFLFVVARSTPSGFIVSDATGIARLGLVSDFASNDTRITGGFILVRRDTDFGAGISGGRRSSTAS